MGGTPDPELAARLAERACDLGHGGSCRRHGSALVNGSQVPADPARGRALFARGCELGDVQSCIDYAVALEKGIGGAVDQVSVMVS